MFGGLNSNCLTNFGMVINMTAASAAFLVPMQAEGKFDPEQLEKAATNKKVVASLLWLTEVELYLTTPFFLKDSSLCKGIHKDS